MKLQSLMNVRPVVDLGSQLIASPTSGNFKLTPDASAKIGVISEDYIKIVKDVADPENVVFYATVGSYSEENGADGSKLASIAKGGGGSLQFSGAAAWQDLGGSTDHNTHFNVEDAVEFEGVKYFPLSFDKKVEKQQRKSSTANTANTANAEPQAESVTDFEDDDFQSL